MKGFSVQKQVISKKKKKKKVFTEMQGFLRPKTGDLLKKKRSSPKFQGFLRIENMAQRQSSATLSDN